MVGALNATFDILTFGAIIVLVVLGLAVIASMMGVFNFAQGEFILLGGYTVYLLNTWNIPTWAGMLVAPLVVGLIGVVLERLVVHRFYGAPMVGMLGTFAIGLMIREGVRGLMGGLQLHVPEPTPGSFLLGTWGFSKWRSIILVVTILVVAGSYWLLANTRVGLQVRSTLENPLLARASGITVRRIYTGTFAFGAALGGLAGALVVPVFGLNAELGVRFLIQGFLAIMLGGFGSFEGPIAGAAIVGVTSAALPWFITPVAADVLVFAMALLVLKVVPGGILSKGRLS